MLFVRLSLRSFGRLRHIQKRTLNGVSIPQHRLTVLWRKYQVLNQAKGWKGWTMSIDLDQCVSKCFSSFLKLPSLHRIHFPTSDNKLGLPSETYVHFRHWKVSFFDVLFPTCSNQGVSMVRCLLFGGSGCHTIVIVPSHRRYTHSSRSAGESGTSHSLCQANTTDRGARCSRWSLGCLKINPKHLKIPHDLRIFDFNGFVGKQFYNLKTKPFVRMFLGGTSLRTSGGGGWGVNRFHIRDRFGNEGWNRRFTTQSRYFIIIS